ncbi:MAG: hypothetical protein GTO00_09175 [Deltaproteobacteria bacterium]|nr:hypothetical protein [Deltaproteobacteria bacterium]
MAEKQIAKVGWWHEAIVDWMLENPDGKLGECAAHFGRTQGWISVIINSDAFKELLEQRKLLHAHMISLTLTEKLEGIAHQSLDALEESLEAHKDGGTMSVGCARDTAEMALKALGYTARSKGALNVNVSPGGNVNISTASPEVLAEARRKMKEMQDARYNDQRQAPGEQEPALLPAPS